MTIAKKSIALFSAIIVFAFLIFIGGRYFFFRMIETKLRAAMQNLEADSIFITYDSLHADPWAGSVTIKGLRAYASNGKRDSTDSLTQARIGIIKIDNLEILPLLLYRKLSIGTVKVGQPSVGWVDNFRFPKTTRSKKDRGIKSIAIGQLTIDSASVETRDTAYHRSRHLTFHNLEVAKITIDISNNKPSWTIGSSSVDSLNLHFAKEFYTLHIRQSHYDATEKSMQIDSILLLPDYDKHLFAQKNVRQIDRVQAMIPSIKMQGLELKSNGKTAVEISRISLNFKIEVYRDKRYPFHNDRKTLPEQFLHDLPFSLQIDTVLLSNSYVLYEEFPENGDSAGFVYFNKLHASMYNISNISAQDARMEAEANFMDAGKLKVHFTFPSNPHKAYSAYGTLTNFTLPRVNKMLGPLTNTKIQSGVMEEMKFRFLYNDFRSDGTVTLHYTDLKMESGKKSNLGNKIVTLLLNTFIRKNMDRNTATDKKTGTILFYRDHQRAIFNYWWKSLLSGIKSVYNLDKITNTNSNKKK